MNRLLKQIIYGIFYLLLLTLVIWLIYYFFIVPDPTCFDGAQNQGEEQIDCGGSCISCVLKNAKPLEISPVDIFENSDGTITVAVDLFNKNRNLGISKLPYGIYLYDQNDQIIFSSRKEIAVYPLTRKVIAEVGLSINRTDVERAEFIPEIDVNQSWQEAEPSISLGVELIEQKVEGDKVTVRGRARNPHAFSIPEAEIIASLFNSFRFRLNVSKTILLELSPFSEKEFMIIFLLKSEAVKSLEMSQTQILVEVKR